MSLLDKLRGNYAVLGLVLAMGCGDSTQSLSTPCTKDTDCKGDRLCVEGYCQGGDDSSDDNSGSGQTDIERKCQQLCDHYWNDCGGLPNADYWFGDNHDNCVERCPNFWEIYTSQEYQDSGEFQSSEDDLLCIIQSSCAELDKVTNMDSGSVCHIGDCDIICSYHVGGASSLTYPDDCELYHPVSGERC